MPKMPTILQSRDARQWSMEAGTTGGNLTGMETPQ